jgi:Gas vesicle synthesis protein GvpL/GvpF.
MRWLELHYVTLSDALAYVEGRAVGRVHVSRVGGNVTVSDGRTEEMAIDVSAIAAESFRVLRRHAVALITMRGVPGSANTSASSSGASFLIDRERWRFFEDVVAEEGRRDPDLRFQLTGPWPPYDFVRMQFGG